MGNAVTWTHADTNRYGGSMQVAEFTVTAGADGTDTATTAQELVGQVVKWELDSDALSAQGVIHGYEYANALALTIRDHWMWYTTAGGAVEVVVYPLVNAAATTNAGGALTTPGPEQRALCGRQTVELAGITEGNTAVVRLYVRS